MVSSIRHCEPKAWQSSILVVFIVVGSYCSLSFKIQNSRYKIQALSYKLQARKELEELEGLEGLEGLKVKRYAVEHFVVGHFTVVIVEQPTQAASAAVSQIA